VAMETVQNQMVKRVSRAIGTGALPAPAASLLRLFHAESAQRATDLAMDVAGAQIAAGVGTEQGVVGRAGVAYLSRQGASLGGGSSEMARNQISERLLNMPREASADRDIPFNQVKRGRS
jgi:alkylation response protein AidB-like acyl-CoA dehydrogenase